MAKKVRWRVKQLRREYAAAAGRDVNLEEVAQQTGISISQLSYIENNKGRGLQFETLEKLAEFYKVGSITDLLSLEDNRRTPRVAALG